MVVEKQTAGFKFGKYKTEVLEHCGQVEEDGRTYRLVLLRTGENLIYYSLRLYGARGNFIKQLMFKPDTIKAIINLLEKETAKC